MRRTTAFAALILSVVFTAGIANAQEETGACCFAECGRCEQLGSFDCLSGFGRYDGDGSVCAPTSCVATGTSTIDPAALVASMSQAGSVSVAGQSWVSIPPAGCPHAVYSTPLAGFPTQGTTFTVLTTGQASLAGAPNGSGADGVDIRGENVRGDTDYDVSVLKIDIDVPEDANCLSLDFRFLSEEYPEFLNSQFNDAFIAELDRSTWSTSGSAISAPDNFAFDPDGNVISINAAGITSMTAEDAAGTTYDGATPLLVASTPVDPGRRVLYLSIFDQGDPIYDSAVFLDRIVVRAVAPGTCRTGSTVLSSRKSVEPGTVSPLGVVRYTIVVENPSDSPVDLLTIVDTLPDGFAYVAGSTAGITTSDPTIAGQDLTWAGPFPLPANGSVSLAFDATASATPGRYFNTAGATTEDLPVTPTGPTAPVDVVETSACSGQPDGTPCDDGNACTVNDACQSETCAGATRSCDDGLFCNGAETCDPESGCLTGTPPCAGQACDEVEDVCVDCLNDADCDDELFCNGDEVCVAGTCQDGTPPCTGQQCDETGDVCVECLNDTQCSDGLFCDGAETCVAGTCQAGTLPCSSGETCDEVSDVCVGTSCRSCPSDARGKVTICHYAGASGRGRTIQIDASALGAHCSHQHQRDTCGPCAGDIDDRPMPARKEERGARAR